MNMKNNITQNNLVIASRVRCGEAIPNTAMRLLRQGERPPRNDMATREVTQ
jgi:hypothetical protein